MDGRTDEALMAAYVAGDAEAHRVLFGRLAPPLLAMARRHLGDRAEAEDVVQKTFLLVHRARHDFRPDARLRPWVFTIAMNLVRDTFRKRARQREAPLELDGRREPASWDDRVERAQQARLVREALATLPHDQRRAIELHWLEERPFAEVAELVGASVSAVKVRAHRGYKRMRAWLESEHALGRGGALDAVGPRPSTWALAS
jgi:RNA polymerase sigma-70 factor (ECF subfamily)